MLERSDIEADVIVGGSNARRQEIEALCAAAHDFLHYHCQVDNMAEFMARADLCLGAGGTTTWERCFLGLPAIVTAVAKNQIRLCEDAAAAGYIRYLGSSANVRQEDICNALRLALQEGLNLCSPFADKAGGSPAAQTDRLYLRDTVAHDAELLYRWRNDETVRRNAFHTEQIGFSEHLCWFEKTLNDPSAHIFILMCGDMPAGQVRINARDGAYVISYSIGAEFRGQGCGACMLTLLERRMRCGAPGAVLTAQVKKDNMPSRRTFEKLGYQCEVEHDYYSYTKRL